jgi:hypothetical protein
MSEEIGADIAVANSTPEAAIATTTTEAAPASGGWLDTFQDPQLKAWAENKKFPNAEAAIKSGYHAEKVMQGTEHYVKVLTEKSTPEEVDAFYGKLGRPSAPDAYSFATPEGTDPTFANAAKEQFHALGLSNEQATKLTEWWNGQAGASTEAQEAQYSATVEADQSALRKEWGAAYDKKISEAKAAAGKFGLEAEQIDGMEKALGFGGLMKFMSNIGSKLGEDVLDSMESNAGSEVMTPAVAAQKLNELKADPNWVAAFFGGKDHPGNADAIAKKAQLSRFIAGGA